MYPDTCNVSGKGKKMNSIDALFLQEPRSTRLSGFKFLAFQKSDFK